MGKARSKLVTVLTTVALFSASFARVNVVLRENGIGPLKVGMSLRRINTVLHENFTVPKEKDDRGCFYVSPKSYPFSLMVVDGRLVRIDVTDPGVATSRGIQVGDSEAKVVKAYGQRLKISPNAYDPIDHYLTVRSKDHRYGIRFETKDRKVQMFYAGGYDAIQYIEGCE